jgi:hypothetical protein
VGLATRLIWEDVEDAKRRRTQAGREPRGGRLLLLGKWQCSFEEVWLGDELFNQTLVREGYAFVTTYPPNVRYVDWFGAAQREARSAGRGVWGRCVHEGACDPAYPDACIPPPPPDLDCSDVDVRRFAVLSPDPHNFDGDRNGIGCEEP